MIISASRRTDIPAFYAEWFANRLREGYALVRNPMNAHMVSRVALTPDVVDCIVYWTKNPLPLLGRFDELTAIPCYVQLTVTGYGKDLEPHLPDKRGEVVPAFIELADRLGKERVIWRYDPIIFTGKYTPAYHERAFAELAGALEGHTEKCVISFVDTYRKNARALGAAGSHAIGAAELQEFCARIAGAARAHGMAIATCAEGIDLEAAGIEHNACVDRALIERILGARLKVGKDRGQRPACGCFAILKWGRK